MGMVIDGILLLIGVVALLFSFNSYLNCFEINWSLFGHFLAIKGNEMLGRSALCYVHI
jgi:p-aminobenzoyl-glutamate transporter AbgT